MGKAMSIAGMVTGGIVTLAFLANLLLGIPFGGPAYGGTFVNVGFIIAGIMLAYLGWNAFREIP
jgi:hypothetical protein